MTREKSLDDDVMHKFLLIHRYLRQITHNVKKQGIPGRQLAILHYLEEINEATVGTIQDYLYISASTASALVKHLEAQGLVVRNRSEEDNRVVMVELTPAGKTLAQTTAIAGIGLLRRRLPELSEDRLRVMDEALSDIMTLMEVVEAE